MRRYNFNKLVRSNIPSRMIKEGVLVDSKKLNSIEYLEQLKLKLIEEANEVAESDCAEKMSEELGDVFQVIISLAEAAGISMEDIEAKRTKKLEINGYFAPDYYINHIEVAEDNSEVISYLEDKNRPYILAK